MKKLHDENLVQIEDLYTMSEKQVITLIKNSKCGEAFRTWQKSQKVNSSAYKPNCEYFVKVGAKVRWINPLVNGKRCSEISSEAKKLIEDNLAFKMDNYIWIDNINF